MTLVFESDLNGEADRRILTLDAPTSQSLLHAALELHKRYVNPLATDALVNATGHEPYHYELEYVRPLSPQWPASIRIPWEVTVGDMEQFFGSEILGPTPELRVTARGPRGGDGFYVATVVAGAAMTALEVYGHVVTGKSLVDFVARRAAGVPFRAVQSWKNSGRADPELLAFVRRQPEWTPTRNGLRLRSLA
jgi:hypothetical protein